MKAQFLILMAFTVLTTTTAYGLVPPNDSRGCRSDADCGHTQTTTKQFEVTGWEAAGFCGDLNSLSPSAREKFKVQYITSSLQEEADLCSVGSPSVLSIHILSQDRDCEADTSAAPMYSAEVEVNYGCH